RLAARGAAAAGIVGGLARAAGGGVGGGVVGAGAVTGMAVWNKWGSLGVALAASAAGRPTLVVTTEDRLLPPPLARRVVIPAAEPAAVLPRPPRGVRVVNRLFDTTPLRLVT